MWPTSFLGLLLPLLAAAEASAEHRYLTAGTSTRATLGLHLGLQRRERSRERPPNDEQSFSYVSMPRQRTLYRIAPTADPVRLVYALCGQPHELDEHDILSRALRSLAHGPSHSEVLAELHEARPGESLDDVETRIRDGVRIYDDAWMPIYPHWLPLDHDGWGTWEGSLHNGAVLDVQVRDSWVEFQDEEDEPVERRWEETPVDAHFDFEVERLAPRAEQTPFNASAPLGLPLVGDTTATQAIIFSPPFTAAPTPEEQGLSTRYPNYTLPHINPTPDQLRTPANESLPDFTLVLQRTVQAPSRRELHARISAASAAQGACVSRRALRKRQSGEGPKFNSFAASVVANFTAVLRGIDGWRVQWIIEGLEPGSNYTIYILGAGQTAGPVYFTTKSEGFACQLVHSLPYCPTVSYSVPIAPPPDGLTTYTADLLPQAFTAPLLSVLRNFSIALGTFRCGHDWWSPIQTCASCFEAYRNWACTIWFPRCSEGTPDAPSPGTTLPPDSAIRRAALVDVAAGAASRSPGTLPPLAAAYQQVLPCVEICQAADRACPPLVGFKCPVVGVNANASYGVGYVDYVRTDGASYTLPEAEIRRLKKLGDEDLKGVEADEFGNRWCAGDVRDFAGFVY
ncbi:hypothetical protein AURDEDRAFT_187821 [Auricularia subglabra TFB-10046 SS5]|nr:hypothetical protein AURDEDRAFT_187821 [Auricularia subglabra TFB-10046 SS5]